MWWLVHKDLVRELRGHRSWPGMLLLGVVLVTAWAIQVEPPVEVSEGLAGGLLWTVIVFSGALAVERSFRNECDDGCWKTLTCYPIAPGVLFLAKMATTLFGLLVLDAVIVPLFAFMLDVPLLARPVATIFVIGLGSIGLAAVSTIIGAATVNLRNQSGLTAMLALPLAIPIVLAGSEATRLIVAGEMDQQWWRCISVLGIFAFVFSCAGTLVFEYIIEE
jgi:heme exporter protein B